jgi:IS1 family transposase
VGGGRKLVRVNSALVHLFSLFHHLAPHQQRYEGIDGNCHERAPSRFLYGFLSGVLAFGLGLRVSYGVFVVGDDHTYFYGLIRWQTLLLFSFFCIVYGLGAFMECVLSFTNPCEESHGEQIVSQKDLTSLSFCNTVSGMANVLSSEKQTAIIAALAEGSSIRSIERITGVHRDTIMRLGVKVGQGCATLLDAKMRDLPCRRLEFDEIWGFIGKKQRHTRVDDDPQFGDVWTFCAIDAETKLVPSFKCGKRDLATAKAFVGDVASRMAGRVQISADALKAYQDAIEQTFGTDVDFGQIIKTYEHDHAQHPELKYSAPKFVSVEKRVVVGSPDMDLVSTSYIERLSATTRLHMRRLTRLTLAFSKKLENFEAAVALHFAYYNLVRRHGTLRCTPAMAAGVEQSFWSVGDLIEASA